jgi:hypothetical protein
MVRVIDGNGKRIVEHSGSLREIHAVLLSLLSSDSKRMPFTPPVYQACESFTPKVLSS